MLDDTTPQSNTPNTITVWMIPQEDYSPIWDYLIRRAGFWDVGYANAYFLNEEKLTRDDRWHLEGTKWQRVEAQIVKFELLWDEDGGGNRFVDGYAFKELYEWEDDQGISTRYWFNALDFPRSDVSKASFLIVEKPRDA